MPNQFLNLRDRDAVTDFIETNVEFLPTKDRKPYLQLVADIKEKKQIPPEHMAEMAKNFGVASWAARRALAHFLQTVGAEFEWEGILEAVEPATAKVLERLRKTAKTKTIDEALRSSDADVLIKPKYQTELELTRPQVQREIWIKHQQALKPMMSEVQPELEAMRKRLKQLREQAMQAPPIMQDHLLSKLDHFEDRIYFGGEAIPLEVLDTELKYDIEDREIPPTDEAT